MADIDLAALLEFHSAHGGLATMTAVRPHLQWGVAELGPGDRVEGFAEKPRSEHWINGGFLCFEPGALGYLGVDSVLEREPLSALARDGQLHAFRHQGFWDCMDTYKDAVALNDLWARGAAPWASLHSDAPGCRSSLRQVEGSATSRTGGLGAMAGGGGSVSGDEMGPR